mmetsp:Transcript_603/g.789  ORF Transcript_603/g.789 Transcript_603/m.789 type:complete len:235 (+) Transcript_603:259-963(+)
MLGGALVFSSAAFVVSVCSHSQAASITPILSMAASNPPKYSMAFGASITIESMNSMVSTRPFLISSVEIQFFSAQIDTILIIATRSDSLQSIIRSQLFCTNLIPDSGVTESSPTEIANSSTLPPSPMKSLRMLLIRRSNCSSSSGVAFLLPLDGFDDERPPLLSGAAKVDALVVTGGADGPLGPRLERAPLPPPPNPPLTAPPPTLEMVVKPSSSVATLGRCCRADDCGRAELR